MRITSVSLTVVIGIASVLGCAGTRGKVSDGVYTSPHKNFTVSVPEMGFGTRIQDQRLEDGGMVSFHDDLGGLKRIDYSPLSIEAISALSDPTKADEMYRAFVREAVLPGLQAQAPGAKMLHERSVDVGSQRGYFFVVEIPEGSTLMDMKAGRRLDSTRGFLYFASGHYMYALSTEQGGLSNLLPKSEGEEAPAEESFDRLLASLEEFKATIRTD